MSTARTTFRSRIATIRSAIDDFLLQDLPATPANLARNRSAKVIRNGLAVQTFNIFEDFVRGRTKEVLAEISATSPAFTHLPDALQKATTVEIMRAVQFQLRLQDKSSHISFTQGTCGEVFSTSTGAIGLPSLAFFHATSNISKDQFRDALAAFGVDSPWFQVSGLCSRLGTSGVPAQDLFTNFANRRHTAAHDPNASVSELDLKQSLRDAVSLGGCFDILLSHCSKSLCSLLAKPTTPLLGNHNSIPIRFIKFSGGRYGEIRENGTKFFRTAPDYTALVPNATIRAATEKAVLAVFDNTGHFIQWSLP